MIEFVLAWTSAGIARFVVLVWNLRDKLCPDLALVLPLLVVLFALLGPLAWARGTWADDDV